MLLLIHFSKHEGVKYWQSAHARLWSIECKFKHPVVIVFFYSIGFASMAAVRNLMYCVTLISHKYRAGRSVTI